MHRQGRFSMSVADAARAVGVVPETILVWIRKGRIAGEKEVGQWWVDPNEIGELPPALRHASRATTVDDGFSRLADQFRHRATHPNSVFALLSFAPLSPRERAIVTELMQTAAIELEHACEEHRQSRLMVQQALERAEPCSAVA